MVEGEKGIKANSLELALPDDATALSFVGLVSGVGKKLSNDSWVPWVVVGFDEGSWVDDFLQVGQEGLKAEA